jgi:drug/metabolite transporter (DMT)-like permease
VTEGRPRVAAALGVAIAAISLAAPLFRLAAPTPPAIIAGTRLAIAAALLSPAVWSAWRGGRLPASRLRAGALAGVFYGLHFGTWVTSLTLTRVASSVTLVTATPLLLAAVGLATGRDRPTARHGLSIGLALIGLLFIGGADVGGALLGDALALAGAGAMAAYLLLVRRLGADLPVLAFQGVATFVGALSLLAYSLVAGIPLAFASPASLGYVALAALIPQLVGHGLLTWVLRHATPTQVGIATVGEPVGASLLAWWLLGEALDPMSGLGCLITLSAVMLSVVSALPRRPASPPR